MNEHDLNPEDPLHRVLAGDLEARRRDQARVHLAKYNLGVYTLEDLTLKLGEIVQSTSVLS